MYNRVVILARIYDFEKKCFTLGGIQTYVKDLLMLLKQHNIQTTVVQILESYKNKDEIEIDSTVIIKLPAKRYLLKSPKQNAFDSVYKKYNDGKTIFIIGTDQMDIKSKALNVVTIQHGIAFDVPGGMLEKPWRINRFFQRFCKLLKCIKNVNRFYNTPNVVCVDYNYYNWFRTLGTIYKNNNCKVILNHATNYIERELLRNKISKRNDRIKILFARRFEEHRGALLFSNVVDKLVTSNYDIEVTFAGTGSLFEILKNKFSHNEKVKFSKYSSEESVKFHYDYDIAVIPTIFSEGSSLSLCEAMAAGCITVSTHVGGMTNIVINEYNGFLCRPTEKDIFESIIKVINLTNKEREFIINNAYETAVTSLSMKRWSKEWLSFLDEINGKISYK